MVLINSKMNVTQWIGLILAGGFFLGMIYAIVEAIIHCSACTKRKLRRIK